MSGRMGPSITNPKPIAPIAPICYECGHRHAIPEHCDDAIPEHTRCANCGSSDLRRKADAIECLKCGWAKARYFAEPAR
jgi:Zn ribbon nucleic-acid-binding protein